MGACQSQRDLNGVLDVRRRGKEEDETVTITDPLSVPGEHDPIGGRRVPLQRTLSHTKSKLRTSKAGDEMDAMHISCHSRLQGRRDRDAPLTAELLELLNSACNGSVHCVRIESARTASDSSPYGEPIESFYDGVHDGPVLGYGVSGEVRRVTHRATGREYALKRLPVPEAARSPAHQTHDDDDEDDEDDDEETALRREIFLMGQLDHPNIVRLEEVYESPDGIWLVEELCRGPDLFDALENRPDLRYDEASCAALVTRMLNALRYLHSKGIVHRDLKLENFLFATRDENDLDGLRLIDFGLSKHYDHGDGGRSGDGDGDGGGGLRETVGTPYTVAPEVVARDRSYDERCDLWGVGVLTYLLLCGETPFGGDGSDEVPMEVVRENILAGRYEFRPARIWDHVSREAKDFVDRLLRVDPDDRTRSAGAARRHPWLVSHARRRRRRDGASLDPLVAASLSAFADYGEMRRLLREVLSFTLTPEQTARLRREFDALDETGQGGFTAEDLRRRLETTNDDDAERLFDAMRFRTGDDYDDGRRVVTWHEFVAAGLDACDDVDRTNTRLAFDRLDADHRGRVGLRNVLEIVGGDDPARAERVERAFREGLERCRRRRGGRLGEVVAKEQQDCLSYEDFVFLVEGKDDDDVDVDAAETPTPSHRADGIERRRRSSFQTQRPRRSSFQTTTYDPAATGTGLVLRNTTRRRVLSAASRTFSTTSSTTSLSFDHGDRE